MKNNFFSALKGLYNQSSTKNTFLLFKNDDNFFKINMTSKYLKWRKFIFIAINIMFCFFLVFFKFSLNIYFEIAIIMLFIEMLLFFHFALQVLSDYIYCKKMIKKNKAELFNEKHEIDERFYSKDKPQEVFSDEYENIMCDHKPKVRIRDIFKLEWSKPNKFLCKKCGSSIQSTKSETYIKIKNKINKHVFLLVFVLFIFTQLFIFVYLNLHKGIKFVLDTAFPSDDPAFPPDINFLDLVSFQIIALIVFIAVISLVYYKLNYFGKFKLVENETQNSSNNDILKTEK